MIRAQSFRRVYQAKLKRAQTPEIQNKLKAVFMSASPCKSWPQTTAKSETGQSYMERLRHWLDCFFCVFSWLGIL
jgi:hypothetical protein